MDIVEAVLNLTQRDVTASVSVASLDNDAPTCSGAAHYWIELEYRRTHFLLSVSAHSSKVPACEHDALFGAVDGRLLRQGTAGWEKLAEPPAQFDAGTDAFSVTAPLAALVDGQGFHPAAGHTLRVLSAHSYWTPEGHDPHSLSPLLAPGTVSSDAAEFMQGSLTVPGVKGDLLLATAQPERFSNGEATTFHWPVEVHYGGHDDVVAQLTLAGTDGLTVHHAPAVKMSPGSVRTVDVYVSMPFQHTHGTTRTFVMGASTGTSAASLDLSIQYPTIPQPAGHHADLFIHGATGHDSSSGGPSSAGAWMNTVQDDESADASMITPIDRVQCQQPGPSRDGITGLQWWIPLRPTLRIGLDARMGDEGSIALTMSSDAYAPPAMVYGLVALYDQAVGQGPDSHSFGADIATYNHSRAVPFTQMPLGGGQDLLVPLLIPPELDRIAAGRAVNLALRILFCPDGAAFSSHADAVQWVNKVATGMGFEAGSHVVLPLDEYHDVLAIPATAGAVMLAVDDPVRRAPPGATVLWTIRAEATAPGDYAIRLLGVDAGATELLGSTRFGSALQREILVAVAVPSQATRGQMMEVIVEVYDEADPAVASAIRLAIEVDPESESDDSAIVDDLRTRGKTSPGWPVAAPILLVLLLMRRRS